MRHRIKKAAEAAFVDTQNKRLQITNGSCGAEKSIENKGDYSLLLRSSAKHFLHTSLPLYGTTSRASLQKIQLG